MKHFALSLIANKTEQKGNKLNQTIHHDVVTLYAVSKEEAIGKGYEMIHSECPSEDEWQGYDVLAIEIEEN